MFQMGSISALHGKHILSATLEVTEQVSNPPWSGSPQLDLYATGAISSSTDWSNDSGLGTTIATRPFPSLSSTAQQAEQFSGTALTTVIANDAAASSTVADQTFGIRADNEGDDTAYRYLVGTGTNSPVLSVTYYSTPNAPSNAKPVEGTRATACNTTAPGTWINASDTTSVTLQADVNSPDTGITVNAQYQTEQTKPTAGAWTNGGNPGVTSQSPAQTTRYAMTGLADGVRYAWRVHATVDGAAYASANTPSSGACYFSVDMTAPSAPVAGSATLPTGYSGTGSTGTLPVTATDGGTDPSGVASFLYNINGTSLTTGGDGRQTLTAASGAATIPLKGERWGTNTVWIATLDAAGNQSQPIHYDFYLPETSYTPGTAGDLDGDGVSDLAAVDTPGNIRLYSDPQTTDSVAPTSGQPAGGQVMIKASQAPNQTGFTGAIIAHNGSFSGRNCDDLVVVQGQSLAVETNNNCATAPDDTWTIGGNQQRPDDTAGKVHEGSATGTDASYNNNDWTSVLQAVVLPVPAGSPATARPVLLTLENYNSVTSLWEYTFSNTQLSAAYKLASGTAWNGVSLMSPGLVNGTPALWVRDNSTGTVTQYQNIENWAAAPLTAAPTGGTVVTSSTAFTARNYPMATLTAPTSATGSPTLWAVDHTGHLVSSDASSLTTTPTLSTPTVLTAAGWADNLQNLGGGQAADSAGSGDTWPLGATDADTAGNNPLTPVGTPGTTTAHDGTPGGAATFDGATTSLGTAGPAVDTSGNFSVSAWVELKDTSTDAVFVTQGDEPATPTASAFQLYYSSTAGTWAFGRHESAATGSAFTAVYSTGVKVTAGSWAHLVGVFSATNQTMTLYVNGRLAATGAYAGTDWASTGSLQIGRGIATAGYNQYTDGAVDQVGVYGTALTADQAAAMYGSDTGAFLFPADEATHLWTLADKAGSTTATDTIGSDDVTPTGTVAFGAVSPAIPAETSTSALHLTGTGLLKGTTAVSTTGSYSVSAWVDLTSSSGQQWAVTEGDANHAAMYLGYNGSQWQFMTTDNAGTTTHYYYAAGGTPVLNTWTHLTGTYDATTDILTLYVNGKQTATATNSTPVAGGNLVIGSALTTASGATGYEQFVGYIADVYTFGQMITADQVSDLYNSVN